MEDTDTGLFRVTVRRVDGRFRNEHATTVRAGSWAHALVQAAQLPAGFKWAYGKAEGEEMSKRLDLKVTVVCSDADPDAILAQMPRDTLRLASSPLTLKVEKVERADGQPLGLEGAFEKYWASSHSSSRAGLDWSTGEQEEARDAYLAAAKKFGAS